MPSMEEMIGAEVKKAVEKAVEKAVKGEEHPPANTIIDYKPAPYQFTEDVDEVDNAIVQKIGGEETYRYPQVEPEMDIKDINPELYRDQRMQSLEGVKKARITRDELHRKIEAVGKIQDPEHLKNLVTGAEEIISPEALDAIADLYICADCKDSFATTRALNMHQMRMAHGEYAEDMPKWERSHLYRKQQKELENADKSDDSGVDNGGSE